VDFKQVHEINMILTRVPCIFFLCLLQPTNAKLHIITVSLCILYTPTCSDLARRKCKTPWWWHRNVETSRNVYYM